MQSFSSTSAWMSTTAERKEKNSRVVASCQTQDQEKDKAITGTITSYLLHESSNTLSMPGTTPLHLKYNLHLHWCKQLFRRFHTAITSTRHGWPNWWLVWVQCIKRFILMPNNIPPTMICFLLFIRTDFYNSFIYPCFYVFAFVMHFKHYIRYDALS